MKNQFFIFICFVCSVNAIQLGLVAEPSDSAELVHFLAYTKGLIRERNYVFEKWIDSLPGEFKKYTKVLKTYQTHDGITKLLPGTNDNGDSAFISYSDDLISCDLGGWVSPIKYIARCNHGSIIVVTDGIDEEDGIYMVVFKKLPNSRLELTAFNKIRNMHNKYILKIPD